jgi:hypothetical protein
MITAANIHDEPGRRIRGLTLDALDARRIPDPTRAAVERSERVGDGGGDEESADRRGSPRVGGTCRA